MNIPDKVKIGGLIYDVSIEKGVCHGLNKAYGTCDYEALEISIEKDYSEQKIKQTFWHEVMHAIDNEYHAGLSEKQIDQMACGLYSVIVDNPDIFKE
jgi:heat shock protein HspQ